jgi:hypothetical protein
MKLTHTLAVIALSTSLGACIVAPHRPYHPLAVEPAPVAVAPVYYQPAPVVQALPFIGLGWWMGRYWGHGHHGHHGHHGGHRR